MDFFLDTLSMFGRSFMVVVVVVVKVACNLIDLDSSRSIDSLVPKLGRKDLDVVWFIAVMPPKDCLARVGVFE